ncbi:MAG: P1 family peptidase [bacterium]|nr:P1 family peptidase [bacterium]
MDKRCRARDLGIKLGFLPPGPLNSLTDVPGVRVGHTTLIQGGDVRTGVTAVVFEGCQGDVLPGRLFAGAHIFSGAGELTGFVQIREWGFIESPIFLTNTLSLGDVRGAAQRYLAERYPSLGLTADPVIAIVGECDDGYLNDMRGRHVKEEHVRQALEGAVAGPTGEGCVGGGTGMYSFDFKSGIGTASRRLPADRGGYSLGCLVMTNMGERRRLSIAGVPVGEEITDLLTTDVVEGSGVVILATDAPLLPQQLGQLARRAAVGLGRVGSFGSHGSGEFVVAVSTATVVPRVAAQLTFSLEALVPSRSRLNPLYEGAIEACEEAVVNSLLMAQTMEGRDGHVAHAIPLDRLREIMRRHGRLDETDRGGGRA